MLGEEENVYTLLDEKITHLCSITERNWITSEKEMACETTEHVEARGDQAE